MPREVLLFTLMPKGCSIYNYFVRRESDRYGGVRKESKNKKYLGKVKRKAEVKGSKGEIDKKKEWGKKRNSQSSCCFGAFQTKLTPPSKHIRNGAKCL